MPNSNQIVASFAGVVILLGGAPGIVHRGAIAAARQISATSVGRDGGSTRTAAGATAAHVTGIGWD